VGNNDYEENAVALTCRNNKNKLLELRIATDLIISVRKITIVNINCTI
jgi:hypothetical protein